MRHCSSANHQGDSVTKLINAECRAAVRSSCCKRCYCLTKGSPCSFAKWKTMVGYNRDVVDYNAYSLVIVLIGENISITIYKLEIIRQLPFTVIDQTPSRFPFNGCNLKPGKLISSISCAVSIAASCIRNLL